MGNILNQIEGCMGSISKKLIKTQFMRLISAVKYGNLDLVIKFHKKGLNFHHHLENGDTALHIACRYKQTKIVQYICENIDKINIDDKNFLGDTPLMIVIMNEHKPTITYLINRGADINAKENQGYTPFMAACASGNLDLVMYLASHDSLNLKLRTNDGQTALHRASFYGHLNIIRYLINQLKMNMYAQDKKGNLPVHYACMKLNISCVRYFYKKAMDGSSLLKRLNKEGISSIDILHKMLMKLRDVSDNTPYGYNEIEEYIKTKKQFSTTLRIGIEEEITHTKNLPIILKRGRRSIFSMNTQGEGSQWPDNLQKGKIQEITEKSNEHEDDEASKASETELNESNNDSENKNPQDSDDKCTSPDNIKNRYIDVIRKRPPPIHYPTDNRMNNLTLHNEARKSIFAERKSIALNMHALDLVMDSPNRKASVTRHDALNLGSPALQPRGHRNSNIYGLTKEEGRGSIFSKGAQSLPNSQSGIASIPGLNKFHKGTLMALHRFNRVKDFKTETIQEELNENMTKNTVLNSSSIDNPGTSSENTDNQDYESPQNNNNNNNPNPNHNLAYKKRSSFSVVNELNLKPIQIPKSKFYSEKQSAQFVNQMEFLNQWPFPFQ